MPREGGDTVHAPIVVEGRLPWRLLSCPLLARSAGDATTAGELVAEGLGTFILICFGDGVVAMAVAALNQSGRGTKIFDASGDWLIIGWGWGLAVDVRGVGRRGE